MNSDRQEIKIKDYHLTQTENDIESFVSGTYNEMVLGLVNKIKNQKTWGMTASTIFINRLFRKQERIATVEFSLANRNYGAKFNFPNTNAKKEFNALTNNMERMRSHYLERFNYQDPEYSRSLLNIFIEYIASNDISEYFKDEESGIGDDLRETDCFIGLENINSITKATLKNWENDFIIGLDVADSKQDEKLINKAMVLPAYHNLFAAISQDNYIFVFGTSAANQHYVDERVRDIENVMTFSLSIFKAPESHIEIFEKFHLFSSTYRNIMLYEFAADLNKNIESSLGEAAEVSRYWYTTAVQKILKESKLDKASDSERFAKLLVEEILAAQIDGVETLETYPFDRVFIFNRPIDRMISEGEYNKVSVSEALLASKISITNQYIASKGIDQDASGKKAIGEIYEHEDNSGSSQHLFEWQRNALSLKEHELNFNKKLIKSQSDLEIPKLKEKYDFKSDYHASDEIVIHSLLNILLHGEELNDVEEARQALLEYKAKYFKDDFLYLYATGVDLPKEIPILHQFQEKYFDFGGKEVSAASRKDTNDPDHLADNEFIKKQQTYMTEDELRNVKVVLASYAPKDETAEDGFTIVVIANQDPVKTTSELNAERDDLRTALELIIRQKFVLQKEYDEKGRKAQEDTKKVLTQTSHTIDNFLKERIENPKTLTISDLKTLQSKIYNLLSPITEALTTEDEKENIIALNNKEPLVRSLDIFKKFFTDNKRFDDESNNPLSYDFFAQKISGLKEIRNRLIVFTYPIDTKDEGTGVKKDDKQQLTLMERVDALDKKRKTTLITEAGKFIELTIDFNELEAFTIDWDETILQDVMHVMFKNACESSFEYINNTDSENAKIFIDLFISRHDNGTVNLNIEFTNFTSEPISRKRLNAINTQTEKIGTNMHKTNSSGIGVATARGRLQHRYNDDEENAGIKFTLLSKDKMKSRLFIPISLILDNDIFAKEDFEEQEQEQDIQVFYLEDEDDYFKTNRMFFDTMKLQHNHKRSYGGFKSSYTKEDVLITDLNILGTEGAKATATDQEHGLDAIKHFLKNNDNGVILVLSTGYKAAKSKLEIHSKKYGYTIYDQGGYTEIQRKSIYIYDKKTFSNRDNEVVDFLKQFSLDTMSENIVKNEKESSVHKVFDVVNIDSIDSITVYTHATDVNEKVFLLDLENKEHDLRSVISKWEEHEIVCDDEEYSISSPIRESYFKTKLIVNINKKCDYPQVRHESLKSNIIFISNRSDVEKTLDAVSSLSINSNGIFSPIRHDFAKVKPFGNISQDDIDYFTPVCAELEECFIADYEKFLSNEQVANCEKVMKEFHTNFNYVIEEAKKSNNELGENRQVLADLFDRYSYYHKTGGFN